jgi:hypothetical protein
MSIRTLRNVVAALLLSTVPLAAEPGAALETPHAQASIRRQFWAAYSAQIGVPPYGQPSTTVTIMPMSFINGAGVANGPVLITDGTAGAPSLAFASNTNTGIYKGTTNVLSVSLGGSDYVDFIGGTIRMAANQGLCWNATNNNASGTSCDTTLARVAPGEWSSTAVLFANLGTPSNGAFAYCSDCTIANPCASGGTGAFAKRLNGVWVCS